MWVSMCGVLQLKPVCAHACVATRLPCLHMECLQSWHLGSCICIVRGQLQLYPLTHPDHPMSTPHVPGDIARGGKAAPPAIAGLWPPQGLQDPLVWLVAELSSRAPK